MEKNVKWRAEDNRILVCDCKTIDFFDLPLQYRGVCAELEKGLSRDGFSADLLGDLTALDLIEETHK